MISKYHTASDMIPACVGRCRPKSDFLSIIAMGIAMGLAGLMRAGNTCTWTGSWDTFPSNADDVIIVAPGGSLTWSNTMPATVGSWTQQAGYTGTATFQTVYGTAGFTNFTVTGDMTISGGALTHVANGSVQTNRLFLTVNGNLTVGTNAAIVADAIGFLVNTGPGKPVSGGKTGGSYGGIGGYGTSPGPTYGSITSPVDIGSGAGEANSGGGAIRLCVGGSTTISGTITVNGMGPPYYVGGSGGSVFLTTGTFSGSTTGVIRANGGYGADGGGGGGGRVSIVLTNAGADFSSYLGLVSANGGVGGGRGTGSAGAAAAGTVYRETPAQGTGHGTLTINNNGMAVLGGVHTLMPASVNVNSFGAVVITNKGVLAVDGDDTLNLGTVNLSCAGPTNSYIVVVNPAGVTFPASYSISGYTLNADGLSAVTGNWNIASNGILSHSVNSVAETYRINLTLTGNLTVNPGGQINVAGLGYSAGYGPGKPNGNKVGGTYGGTGGNAAGTNGPTYGSIVAPVNLGSGSGEAPPGGGAIILRISGALTNNGIISANGGEPNYTGGSGGSVFLTAGTISGATGGVVSANGGRGNDGGGGGGGRVSIVLTSAGADFGSFSNSVTAYGGYGARGSAAAGTIYRQAGGLSAGAGTVIVDNGSTATNQTYTAIPAFSNTTENITKALWMTTNTVRLGLLATTNVASLTLNANGFLELGGNALTVKALSVTNKVCRNGTYGPHNTPILALTDSGSAGKVVVNAGGGGSAVFLR